MKKSAVLVAVPAGVLTVICPDAASGTLPARLVVVADETAADLPLNLSLLSVGVVSKFVPVIATLSPTAPTVGVKLEMVGGPPLPSVTVKFTLLFA